MSRLIDHRPAHGLRDIAVRLAPLGRTDAAETVRSLKTYPLLTAFRGEPTRDVSALEAALLATSALAEDLPEVVEVDGNPIIVAEHGAIVVDARVRVEAVSPPPARGDTTRRSACGSDDAARLRPARRRHDEAARSGSHRADRRHRGRLGVASRLDDRAAPGADVRRPRVLRARLAHNPKIAPLAEQAGFDLQLSGYTHAGQFFPWTIVIHWVHGPHAAGLSRRGRLWVHVSAGTGTWGPPVRVRSWPELTLLRFVAAERR